MPRNERFAKAYRAGRSGIRRRTAPSSKAARLIRTKITKARRVPRSGLSSAPRRSRRAGAREAPLCLGDLCANKNGPTARARRTPLRTRRSSQQRQIGNWCQAPISIALISNGSFIRKWCQAPISVRTQVGRDPSSFRRRPESVNTGVPCSSVPCSWIPDQVRDDERGLRPEQKKEAADPLDRPLRLFEQAG